MKEKYNLLFFLGPGLLYLFFWKIFPLLYTLYISLLSWKLLKPAQIKFVGLQNIIDILTNQDFYQALLFTVKFAILAAILELILGTLFALLFDNEFRFIKILQAIVLVPMVITPVVVGTIWYILYHDTIGPINYILRVIGLPTVNWLTSTSNVLSSIIIMDIWHWTPFMFILILSGLQSIPQEIYEAARIDGASFYRTFLYITLPQLKNIIFVAIILRFMDAFRMFDEILLMTGGGPGRASQTVSLFVYRQAFGFFDMGHSSATIVILLSIMAAVYYWYTYFTTV